MPYPKGSCSWCHIEIEITDLFPRRETVTPMLPIKSKERTETENDSCHGCAISSCAHAACAL
jgi:hypothetical protein